MFQGSNKALNLVDRWIVDDNSGSDVQLPGKLPFLKCFLNNITIIIFMQYYLKENHINIEPYFPFGVDFIIAVVPVS